MELRPGYKHTEIGVIPNEWTVGAARDLVCSMKSGLSRRLHVQDIGLPVLTSTNIQDNRLVSDSLKYWYAHDPQGANTADYKLNDGDILLCFINSLAQIGKPCIYRDIGRPVIYTTNIFRIVASENTVPEFAVYLFSLNSFQAALQLIAKPAVNQASFTKHDFLDIPVPLPSSKTEQRAIATALSDVDALIAGLERLIAKKRDIKQAAMQQLLTGQTRLPGFSGEWVSARLGNVASLKNGYMFRSETYTPTGDYKVITIANVQDGHMISEGCSTVAAPPIDIQRHQELLIGDILISMTGNVGRVCRVSEQKCLLNQRVGKLEPREVTNDFLFALLRQSAFIASMIGAAKGGAQPNLSASDINEYVFFMPKDEREQTAIARVLADMDADLAAVESRLTKTRAIKQGMMQELLTGRTRLV
jgi:type I restriction enzyme S subunit